jgi:hypothetical protein
MKTACPLNVRRVTAAIALTAMFAGTAAAQPTNVRAWYAQGQVFVVWERPAPPAAPTDTVEIYTSAAAQATIATMSRVGKLFSPEYTGARLTALNPAARLQVPTPGGAMYRLAANEGVFAYTPHAAGNLFFAVVDAGNIVVNAANSDTTAFNYDPVNEPVRPHPQFNGATAGGNTYTAYAVFADGSDNYNNSRPDFPVMADADKNGVPHVFVVSNPVGGLPAGTRSCLFAHHGGGGEYQLFLPGVPARANLSLQLSDGIVVTPDDSYYANIVGTLERSNTSWFGYATSVDPFTIAARTSPPVGSTIVNFTQRRAHWIMDWVTSAASGLNVDTKRVAAIGHSGGGRGLSHLSRLRPERYASVVCYTPASDLTQDSTKDNFLRGNWDDNYPTNIVGPGGVTLGVTDVFTMTTRLSVAQRDFALTRFFYGTRDEDTAATWSAAQRAVVDSLNDSQAGYLISWDEREHGVEKWDNETNDAADGHAGPWPDVGQWISPARTRRSSGQYLVSTYRADQTYPGFFNADADANLAGRQPDPGPGDPDLGDPWGTWGGYFDWNTATLVDLATRWEATIFASAFEPVSIDNALATEYLTDLSPRKTANFNPAPGTTVYWYTLPSTINVVQQQGVVTADAEGRVTITGVRVPRRDVGEVRVYLSTSPLCLGQSSLTPPQPVATCRTGSASFSVVAQGSGPITYQWRRNGVTINPASNPSAATPTLSLTPIDPGDAASYDCIVTSPCGIVISPSATLKVCGADFNCDGFLDFTDFDDFVIAFEAGEASSDFNADGFLDFTDFDDFVAAFEAGC